MSTARAAALAVCLVALAAAPAARALPMGSVESWMVMGDAARTSRDLYANYALTPRDALGAGVARWRERLPGGGELARDTAALTYTRLLTRWNLPHAQANLWLVAQAGQARTARAGGGRGEHAFGALAWLADYETTRVYTGAGLRPLRGGDGLRWDQAWWRGGFSFYEAEYDEVQPWFVVEVRRERGALERNKSLDTALLRFIHRRFFVEIGGHREGAVLNFMFNY